MNTDVVFVTGGAGFIGSNFVLEWFANRAEILVNIDKLTYAGNPQNLAALAGNDRYIFSQTDINDSQAIAALFSQYQPKALIHFAAESHVDRSIAGPEIFIQTNVNGTFNLLEKCREYWNQLQHIEKEQFRFIHVSTDEVYGTLGPNDAPFTETTAYAPNSPYAASKAASDHLARAYFHTYKLPTIITNCSNNYGPYQFPEKLIPLVICNALDGKAIPIYGDGLNVRDWLYVSDHVAAIREVLDHGRIGENYNIGGWNEKTNLAVVQTICDYLDQVKPAQQSYATLIQFIKDRPGHDKRYAIDANKIKRELGWQPREQFETGIRKTIDWYLANENFIQQVQSGEYRHWIERQYT